METTLKPKEQNLVVVKQSSLNRETRSNGLVSAPEAVVGLKCHSLNPKTESRLACFGVVR